MNMETFIGKCVNDMVSKGVSVEITPRKRTGKFGYNYFYDGTHPDYGKRVTFKINYYTPSLTDIFDIFVHEYCHFLQWKDEIPLWAEARGANKNLDDYLEDKQNSCSIEDLRMVQKLELDCDRRAVELIKAYNLPVDLDRYIVESNGYILSYNLIHKARMFFITSAYGDDRIKALLPKYHISEDELGMEIEGFEETFLKVITE